MLFNSRTFLVFFVIVLALHYAPFFSHRFKKLNLLLASYIFYAVWNPPFVLLIWISTIIDWFACKGIYNARSLRSRRGFLFLSLGANLGLLSFFKYGEFLLENFTQLMAFVGVDYAPAPLSIVLPVGISFYTFQTMSYTLDTYLKRGKPWGSFLDYALYVTFFPQLVAGPIVRASDFLPQCLDPKKFNLDRLGWGFSLITLGLFEKVFIADFLMAPIVDKVYASELAYTFVDAWLGTLAFSIQIFCDFAGYSTCAIGVAMCLGFDLPRNFKFPYAAIGFSDFWLRWHISLSSWLRDYLYIPLGGNRKGHYRTYVNLMITMLLGGLWHGASWTFVCWGALHGLYLVVERWLKALVGSNAIWKAWWIRIGFGLLTYVLVCLTWVLFRALNFGQAFELFSAMVDVSAISAGSTLLDTPDIMLVTCVVGIFLIVQGLLRNANLDDARQLPWWSMSAALGTMIILIMATPPGDSRAFIYFQF